VFIQFGIGVLLIMAYFVVMFVFSLQYISNIQIITQEMNVLAQAESYYSLALNIQREMIYNPSKPILNKESFIISKDSIEQLYTLNQKIFKKLGFTLIKRDMEDAVNCAPDCIERILRVL
jgi:hypothetical protein